MRFKRYMIWCEGWASVSRVGMGELFPKIEGYAIEFTVLLIGETADFFYCFLFG